MVQCGHGLVCKASVICCIEAAVRCSELAWCSVRCDRSRLPLAISCEACVMDEVPVCTTDTMPRNWPTMSRMASSRPSLAPGSTWMLLERSPRATWPAGLACQCAVGASLPLQATLPARWGSQRMLPRLSESCPEL